MRKVVAKIANVFFRPMGLKVMAREGQLGMSSALRRAVAHRFPIRTIIDIGASDGPWSLMAMQAFPEAHCLAIEALHEQTGALERMKQSHERFDYAICAAGAKDGTVEFMVSPVLDWSGIDAVNGTPRQVPLRSLDSLVREKKLPGPYLVKFDTHGYELPILEGATEVIKDASVLIMEVYNFKPGDLGLRFPEMCLRLESLGFRCYDMAGPMYRKYDESLWQMDLCFAKDDAALFQYPRYA